MGRAREGDGEDASLYLRALAFEQEGDMAAARKAYFELIKSFPKSPHVPGAYFAFGEHFLEQSKADRSKLDVAREFFRKVQQFPPPKNSLYALASYRLAEI